MPKAEMLLWDPKGDDTKSLGVFDFVAVPEREEVIMAEGIDGSLRLYRVIRRMHYPRNISVRTRQRPDDPSIQIHVRVNRDGDEERFGFIDR